MSWTLCTSGAAITLAGANANSSIIVSGGGLADYSDQAEGQIEFETRTAWRDNYSSLTSGAKHTLQDVSASLIAMNIISYDNTGYLTREADTLLNVLDDRVKRGLKNVEKSDQLKDP